MAWTATPSHGSKVTSAEGIRRYGKLFEPIGIQSGVPQQSILGPILFLLFINDLPLVLKNNIGFYADDSTLKASVPTLADVEEKIRPDIDSYWRSIEVGEGNENQNVSREEKIQYNLDQTDCKFTKTNSWPLIWRMQLTKVESERDLGVYIDSPLTWNEHIDILRRKLLQKRCVRLILDSPRDARSFDNFQKLKWFSIDQMFRISKLGPLKKVIVIFIQYILFLEGH